MSGPVVRWREVRVGCTRTRRSVAATAAWTSCSLPANSSSTPRRAWSTSRSAARVVARWRSRTGPWGSAPAVARASARCTLPCARGAGGGGGGWLGCCGAVGLLGPPRNPRSVASMSVIAVVGAQWGDEGKGRVVDYLAVDADLVVRYGGGNNAGHTVVNRHGHFKLHLTPSGIF